MEYKVESEKYKVIRFLSQFQTNHTNELITLMNQ
jgi:hypothetical protein